MTFKIKASGAFLPCEYSQLGEAQSEGDTLADGGQFVRIMQVDESGTMKTVDVLTPSTSEAPVPVLDELEQEQEAISHYTHNGFRMEDEELTFA